MLNYLISCEVGFTWSAINSTAAIVDMGRLDSGLRTIAEMKQAVSANFPENLIIFHEQARFLIIFAHIFYLKQ